MVLKGLKHRGVDHPVTNPQLEAANQWGSTFSDNSTPPSWILPISALISVRRHRPKELAVRLLPRTTPFPLRTKRNKGFGHLRQQPARPFRANRAKKERVNGWAR